MSATDLDPVETRTDSDGPDDDLHHFYCPCNEDLALCGKDISEEPHLVETPSDNVCVVCEDLTEYPCPHCAV